jgi:tetratricopeptide (TPR) repeat protein
MALGAVLRERGQVEPALALQRAGLKALGNSYPAGHPDLAAASLELGRTLVASGQLEEAEQHLRSAAEVRRQRLGGDHWRTAEADLRLGECLAARGRTREARDFAQASRATLYARRGARDPFARAAAELLRVTSTSQTRP